MKTVKLLLIATLIVIMLLPSAYAISGINQSFAYGNSEKVIFLWSKYDSSNTYNNFDYYKIIRTNSKTNISKTLYIGYNRELTKYTDNNPLLGQWSTYKTCTVTTNNKTFCSNSHKIYISYANNYNNTYTNTTDYTYNTNSKSNISKGDITYSSHNYKNYYPYSDNACPAVEQPATNPQTGECRVYSNPCEVPVGWKNVATCNVEDNELSTAMKRRLKTIILNFVNKVVEQDIEDYKKLDILERAIDRFDAVVYKEDTRLSYVAKYCVEILEEEYNRYSRDYSLDTGIYYQMNEFLNGSY